MHEPDTPLVDRLYAELKPLFDRAVNALHGRTASGRVFTQEQVDDFISKQNPTFPTFQRLADELKALEPYRTPENSGDVLDAGAAQRTVMLGHKLIPFTDELAGVMGAVTGEGYKKGRDVNRAYLSQAERDQGGLRSGLLTAASIPAGALAATGLLPAGAGALKSIALGAGVGGGMAAGELPEFDLPTIRENKLPLALGTGLGALAGITGNVKKAFMAPEAAQAEELLRRSGGPAGVLAHLEESGIQRPMLAEAGGPEMVQAGVAAPRQSATGRAAALDAVTHELEGVRSQLADVSQRYDVLNQTVIDPRVQAVVKRKIVKKLLKSLDEEGVGLPDDMTARTLEDLRQELGHFAERSFKAKHPRPGKAARANAAVLEKVLTEAVPEYPAIRQEWAPLSNRARTLEKMVGRLNRAPRGGAIPISKHPGPREDLMRALGYEPWQRTHTAATRMAEHLFTAGTPAEGAARLQGILPQMEMGGGSLPLGSNMGGGAAAPLHQLTDPFFPLRAVSDSQ